MSELTRDEEIFLKRVAAEIVKANPAISDESQLTPEVIQDGFKATLARDQYLIDCLFGYNAIPALKQAFFLSVYNDARIAAMEEEHAHRIKDEQNAGNHRVALFAMGLEA